MNSPKRLGSIFILLLTMSGIMLLDSCGKKDEPDPIPLKANAGADQSVAPLTVVTLDGSASTGDGTLQYLWTMTNTSASLTESDLGIVNKNEATLKFTPPKNGVYNFTLRVTKGSQFNEDQVVVTVSGVISLGGTLTADLALKDIEPGPGPDYKITSDLIFPAGRTFSLPANAQIVIEASENTGIIIDGGSFSVPNGVTLKFTAAAGWKGFLLKSGALIIPGGVSIESAGKTAFDGQTETAAITAIAGGSLSLTSVNITKSAGYDLLVTSFTGSLAVQNNIFSAAKPIKSTINQLPYITSNSFTAPYDYNIITTPGAGTAVSTTTGAGFTFQGGVKYYIDGDLTLGSSLNTQSSSNPQSSTTILMKAGAGILASGGISLSSYLVMDGLNSAPWKGIAIGKNGTISGLTIKNAGSAVFNTGSFTSDAKAAIYYFSEDITNITGTEIIDSKGYGLYIASANGYVNLSGVNKFTNPASPGINVKLDKVNNVISTSTNSFTMPAGVAAVEVRVPNSTVTPVGDWYPLGDANFYSFTGSVVQGGGSWTLKPGVNLKLKAGRFIDLQQGLFIAIGTSENPITFDSEAGTSGTWQGILVQTTYKIEYCQIKNGGDSNLLKGATPATEKANIVFNYGGATANSFKNNTVTGSAGYGILVEATKQNPDAANVSNANTFSANTSGNIIVK